MYKVRKQNQNYQCFGTKFSKFFSVWILGIKKCNKNVLKIYWVHWRKKLRDQIFNEFFLLLIKCFFDCVPKFSRIEWDIKKLAKFKVEICSKCYATVMTYIMQITGLHFVLSRKTFDEFYEILENKRINFFSTISSKFLFFQKKICLRQFFSMLQNYFWTIFFHILFILCLKFEQNKILSITSIIPVFCSPWIIITIIIIKLIII